MEDKSSTNMFLVAIVAMVAIVSLVVLYFYVMTPSPEAYMSGYDESGVITGEAAQLRSKEYAAMTRGRVGSQQVKTTSTDQRIRPGGLPREALSGRLPQDNVPKETPCNDLDKDGYQNQSSPLGCSLSTSADCNDADSYTHPGAFDYCDGRDNNCDGTIEDPSVCPVCTDSDGGYDPTTPGRVTETRGQIIAYGNQLAAYTYFEDDKCRGDTLYEYSCGPSNAGAFKSTLRVNMTDCASLGLTCYDSWQDRYYAGPKKAAYCRNK